MAAGYKDFTAGAVLTAADLEDYCELQTVMRFASAAARDTALSAVLTEGLHAYLIDTNSLCVYTGSAWSTIGPVHGALTTWTPAVTQSGSVSVTVTKAVYQRIGRWVNAFCELTVTGSGTGGVAVTVSMPVAPVASTNPVVGTFGIYDTSATTFYHGFARYLTATNLVSGYANGQANALGNGGFTAGLAVNDSVYMSIGYEAAADA